ncbi:MBL fold metallo-hydrolase [Spongiibacter taiwanensis]|uniref:alkyl sulfatase dimerization domain-containing protein n=1 Tax=Spongiibacter taiwanensis TaxID=1748242 RepID=UPI0020364DDA|nr:alkyl sulfatase dimerization domain-containing protein [Spongiibacter taiwanensis]USA44490.1 MBL fold metallo-hydrolase [Spongiibacter taiwanensis]
MNVAQDLTRQTPLFYRGDFDQKVVTADNGAKVNSDYLRFIRDGSWGKVGWSEVRPGVFAITGLGFNNHVFVESERGLILFDTGTNIGTGREILKIKRQFSDRPVVAIIYSHHHYTQAAQPIIDAFPEEDIAIYAHPQLEQNLLEFKAGAGSAVMRRAQMQTGMYLPQHGEDAALMYGFSTPRFADNDGGNLGHVSPTHLVADEEEVAIDGQRVVFYHTSSDATDSLTVHFPELELVLHNAAIMPMMFPLYTLRGERYRVAEDLIQGIDRIRQLRPHYMVGCHGFPVIGEAAIQALATHHRDAYAYLLQQTIRGINLGRNPDQLVRDIQLPPSLRDQDCLFAAYIDPEYIVRGIYRGLVGWWADDAAEIHPPEPEEYHRALVDGFGGSGPMIAAAQRAFDEKKYNLAAKLMSSVVMVEPALLQAKQLKAAALRKMAQATPTGIQTRNFLLTEALALEGKIDKRKPPAGGGMPPPGLDMILSAPPGTHIRLLENAINPAPIVGIHAVIKFSYTDLNLNFGFALRHGAGEFMEEAPSEPDLHISLTRPVWAEIILGKRSFAESQRQGSVNVVGDSDLLAKVTQAFADVWGQP